MKKIKVIFYWASIVLPLIDAILGVKDGVKKAAQQTADDLQKAAIEKKRAAERELWDKANGVVRDVIDVTDNALKEDGTKK